MIRAHLFPGGVIGSTTDSGSVSGGSNPPREAAWPVRLAAGRGTLIPETGVRLPYGLYPYGRKRSYGFFIHTGARVIRGFVETESVPGTVSRTGGRFLPYGRRTDRWKG